MHVERFSDKKKTIFTRDSLPQVLVFDECVKELVPGMNNGIGFTGNGYVFCGKIFLLFFMHLRFLVTNNLELNW
jgi:hypothetical protein